MRTPLAVLDTNIAVPGLVGYARGPDSSALATACIAAVRDRRVRLAFSPETLEELLDVLQRPPFGLSFQTARRNVRLLERHAKIVALTGRLAALQRDPDDNVVLETAVVARADYLVTRNVRDFAELVRAGSEQIRYRGVTVLPPGDFLRAVRHGGLAVPEASLPTSRSDAPSLPPGAGSVTAEERSAPNDIRRRRSRRR